MVHLHLLLRLQAWSCANGGDGFLIICLRAHACTSTPRLTANCDIILHRAIDCVQGLLGKRCQSTRSFYMLARRQVTKVLIRVRKSSIHGMTCSSKLWRADKRGAVEMLTATAATCSVHVALHRPNREFALHILLLQCTVLLSTANHAFTIADFKQRKCRQAFSAVEAEQEAGD